MSDEYDDPYHPGHLLPAIPRPEDQVRNATQTEWTYAAPAYRPDPDRETARKRVETLARKAYWIVKGETHHLYDKDERLVGRVVHHADDRDDIFEIEVYRCSRSGKFEPYWCKFEHALNFEVKRLGRACSVRAPHALERLAEEAE